MKVRYNWKYAGSFLCGRSLGEITTNGVALPITTKRMSFVQRAKELVRITLTDRSLFEPTFQKKRESEYRVRLLNGFKSDRLPSIDLLQFIPTGSSEIVNYTYLSGNSLPTDMALIKEVARSFEDCVFLEIGSWRGETLSNIAQVARRCFSLTLGPDDMKRLGFHTNTINSHGLFTKGMSNVEEFFHNSMTFDFSKLPERPNLIFVDGDHSYEAVKQDTQNAFRILKEDGIIIWHDYGSDTEHVRHEVMAAIVDGTPAELRQHLYHVSNTLCAIFTKKAYPATTIKPPVIPDKKFTVHLQIAKL